ncbi:hypothetical protein [Streptomyces sp. NPDC005507]|uniref:hypothetical protein n=1 Tax=Streptomyces sp. NPDC005507 TaxID=3154885 RepID=UPI0033A2966C
MPETALNHRGDQASSAAGLLQPQWQNLFVAPAYPEGFAEEAEQDWTEKQAPPVQRHAHGARRPHRRAA